MACVYPEARSPVELWENILAQRRAFRRIPDERLRREDYFSSDPLAPDHTYAAEAAVIEGYEFDRVAFRVVGSTYRSADPAHWLALDVASRTLADAGFQDGAGLDRAMTGVVLGNTLTGEFSRANILRLRWPYVRRVLDNALTAQGWAPAKRHSFLDELEPQYKAPFPPVGEETLAGGLSNTIAGRICNQFDFKGGGYTVDGACASSLLAVANACSALAAGDLDVALAGGVDLSLDPFEIVGFAKTGALAPELMRIYDTRSAGFWPGEGCGFVLLMRHADALARRCRIYASIHGWGISSDGAGGITRPEADGQLEAIRRAYRRAGYGPDTVDYFEGHGTGTAVGDATELQVLTRARREAGPGFSPAAIGSVKANIGHTKAAAGIAGLLKAIMAVHTEILPPTTGCESPAADLQGPAPALRILREPERWPSQRPRRASVSAMGFGGMNAHVTIEGPAVLEPSSSMAAERDGLSASEQILRGSSQDAEIFLFRAADSASLRDQVGRVLAFALRLSRSELADVAAELQRRLQPGNVRAAIIASTPAELSARLQTLLSWVSDETVAAENQSAFLSGDAVAGSGSRHRGKGRHDSAAGIFLGTGIVAPRIGFLFPGQASPANASGGAHRLRFAAVRELYAQANLPRGSDGVSTDVAQPAIVTASIAGLRILDALGVTASAAIGHSLGELTALHWAGVFDEAALVRIARTRGRAMADLGSPTGGMAAISDRADRVKALLDENVFVVGYNSPRQTVVAGEVVFIDGIIERARARGTQAVKLAVSHAFHTPLVAAAAPELARHLAGESFAPAAGVVFSTVTGAPLSTSEDLRALLTRQVTSPVQFIEALVAADAGVDCWIEVGPGQVLRGLAADTSAKPCLAIDTGGASLKPFLETVAALFALGAPLNASALFADRFTRPFALDWQPRFFVNPCELAPLPDIPFALAQVQSGASRNEPRVAHSMGSPVSPASRSPLELLRQLVAERAELPPAAIQDDSRFLGDLHLNSISVGQVVAEAARRLGLAPLVGLTEFANATVGRVAEALEDLRRLGSLPALVEKSRLPAGVDSWIRPFHLAWLEKPLMARTQSGSESSWEVFAPAEHPFAGALRRELSVVPGNGVVVCLSPQPSASEIPLLLHASKQFMASRGHQRFIIAQHGWGGGGFARTLFLETPDADVCVINVPAGHAQAVQWICAEAGAAKGFVESAYDAAGIRREPRLQFLSPAVAESGSVSHRRQAPTDRAPAREFAPGPNDVLLVTGGGKGIAAECALELARRTGVKLALLGRATPAADPQLSANLERFAAANIQWGYFTADVTDAAAVRVAIEQAGRDLGKITAVLHGAGTNVPRLLAELDEPAFRRTLAPKVDGLRHVLAAIDVGALRLCVTFGSIIARIGLVGEADYALANEWQTAALDEFQSDHPQCRCLALEWSVWSGVGMGERLGRIESLLQQGITPIPPDVGVGILCDLVSGSSYEGKGMSHDTSGSTSSGPCGRTAAIIITGRFGDPQTLAVDKPELPFLRFLERPRAFYPGIELVADATLSPATDPYLEDHIYHGERLFPAVLGLEAMAQAAMAVSGIASPPWFETVNFARPIVVPRGGELTLRLAALV
ncbi:MAG: enediyne polyketide synthase, partial [Verrucomicrobiota bacterium]